MSLVFQLRNAAVHNAGVVTESDAAKLRILARRAVAAPRLLVPTRMDVYSVKLFLDESAELINDEIAKRLVTLLDAIRVGDPAYDVTAQGKKLAVAFQQQVTLGGVTSTP